MFGNKLIQNRNYIKLKLFRNLIDSRATIILNKIYSIQVYIFDMKITLKKKLFKKKCMTIIIINFF